MDIHGREWTSDHILPDVLHDEGTVATGALHNLTSSEPGDQEDESNQAVVSTGNIVQSTWFETNGTSNGGFAVRVSAAATNSRILTSLFSNNDILDPSPSTLRCYNTAVGPLIADNCP
jgi:hypothetical protein